MFATPSLSEKPPDTPVPQWLEPCVVAEKQTKDSYWSSQNLQLSHWLARDGNGCCALGQVWHISRRLNHKQKLEGTLVSTAKTLVQLSQ